MDIYQFEPKTMAYACLFAGTLGWLKGAWRECLVDDAGYLFSFLVGGWFMLTICGLFLYFQRKGPKTSA